MSVATATSDASAAALERLLGYLVHDPHNLTLLTDATAAALEVGALNEAAGLIARYAALSPLSPVMLNLQGLTALQQSRFDEAAHAFELLFAADDSNAAVAFNLAWTKAMVRDYEGALILLDNAVMTASPQAPKLKVQMLHHLGRLDEALECGRGLLARNSKDAELAGALAAVAMDAEDLPLAQLYASQAGGSADGQAALGMLMLKNGHIGEAHGLFEGALKNQPKHPRALLGMGLELLLKNEPGRAAHYLDEGARLFERHLGSWVAAGWAHLIAGDLVTSRARFEHALMLDDRFAETQGALAVLDLLEGHIEAGKRRADVATRLDRNGLAAVLAQTFILAGEGKVESAQRLREIALNRPLSPGGLSISQSMVVLGLSGAKVSSAIH